MKTINFENILKNEYENIYRLTENKPEWAVKKNNGVELVHPAIPFVGEKYNETNVLLYASAENLSGYDGYLDDDAKAINRRKNFFNSAKKEQKYFPHVHIRPVEDGSLLISSAYILNIIGERLNYINPYEFIEHIAVDNFCKFSIENKNNKDYPQDIGKIKYSFEYIKADLRILKPKTITLPKTLYEHNDVKKLFNDIVQNCQIIPIYQISCGNINRIISKKYQKKEKSKIDDIFIEWQKHLENRITGKTNENFYSVYTYLEKIVKSTNGT